MSTKYIKLARETAISGRTKDKGYHLASVCIRSDGSITKGHNTRSNDQNRFVHAEAKSILKAGHGAKLLIVVRVFADNTLALAKPCNSCQRLIKQYKVKKVIYSISNNEFGVWYPGKEKINK